MSSIFENSSGWKGYRVQTVNYGWVVHPGETGGKAFPSFEVVRIESATSVDYEWIKKPPKWWLKQIGKSFEDVMKECIECIKKGENCEQ